MRRQLANGLILRSLSEGIASDREQLPDFYARINGEGDPEEMAAGLAVWTQDLMNSHPLTTLEDIFVVVDPAHEDRVVSATLLIPQTWRYEEIPIAVGRPELVGTEHEYRGRGLVRALFEAVHERSAALGHQLLGITGIPYFYRQFGYSMAVDLGNVASYPLHMARDRGPDYTPSFTLRPAVVEDIADIARWHDGMARERLVTDLRSAIEWQHAILGHSRRSVEAKSYQIIVNKDAESVGYLALNGNLYHKQILYCSAYVVGEEASYLATFKDVMADVNRWALERFGSSPGVLFFAGGNHPSLYTMIDLSLGGVARDRSYKWYLRVPDLIAFLRHIQPVLERRLEGSGAHRYTGDFKVGFYDSTGISISFERGQIVEIEPIKGNDGYDISFPWHLFLNVLFGDHSYAEMRVILPDVSASSIKSAVLVNTLFPKKKSWLEGMS